MIGQGGGLAVAHLQDVHDHGMDSGVWVTPDVVEETEGSDVKDSFNW